VIALTCGNHNLRHNLKSVIHVVTITTGSQSSHMGHTCGSLPGMDRTVRENALKLAGQLEHAETADDPMLPGVIRGLSRVIGRYLAGNPAGTGLADGIHPARARLRELLAERGEQGATAGTLWDLLRAEGHGVARETLHRWLAADERAGLVRRPEQPRRKTGSWVIKQPPVVFRAGEQE
jgi:hypothetical protein